MLRTFNMGVGMTIVAAEGAVARVQRHLSETGCESYVIGEVVKGGKKVVYRGRLRW